MSTVFAKSTIAMSAYNFLAVSCSQLSVSQILKGISEFHAELSYDFVAECMDELFERRLVTEGSGFYDVIDKKRRVIIERDRSDATLDADGNPEGGWNGWVVRDGQASTLTIEEVSR